MWISLFFHFFIIDGAKIRKIPKTSKVLRTYSLICPYSSWCQGLELSYKKLAFQECERGLGGQGVVDLGLLGLDIGLKGGLDVGS